MGRYDAANADMNAFRRAIQMPQVTSLFYSPTYVPREDSFTRSPSTVDKSIREREALDAARSKWNRGLFMGIGKSLLITGVLAAGAALVIGTGGLAAPVVGALAVAGVASSAFQIYGSTKKWEQTERIIKEGAKSDDPEALQRAVDVYAYESGSDMGSGVFGMVSSVFGGFGVLTRGGSFFGSRAAGIVDRFRNIGSWRDLINFPNMFSGGVAYNQFQYWAESGSTAVGWRERKAKEAQAGGRRGGSGWRPDYGPDLDVRYDPNIRITE